MDHTQPPSDSRADAPGEQPRVPLPADIVLPGLRRTIPVNHCRMAACANFGVPARTERGRPGPSADRDEHYKLHSTAKGRIPAVRCKACLDNPPVKSNAAIAAEVQRVADESGVWQLEEKTACRNPDCENHHRTIASFPEEYRKRGKPKSGQGQYHQCKRCGRITLVSDPVRLHDRNRRHAVDVFGRIANKSPVRGTVRGARLNSIQDYYPIVDFLHRRCRAYSGAVDRALIDGRLKLPEDINLQSDAQVYRLNWISRLDRRNVELSSYCTLDADTQFVLGMHTNFDGRVDPFAINAESVRIGDLDRPEAFRRYAQYWLAGDELRGGRSMARRGNEKARISLLRQIERLYSDAASREDVENIELQGMNDNYVTPQFSKGLQVHMPYTAYGHWFLLHRILTGAGVQLVQANMDIDSMGRAAFLCAFIDEVKAGTAHAFYVKYTKHQTIDERREILADSRDELAAFRASQPDSHDIDRHEVARLMMKVRLQARTKHGKWGDDEWVEHPLGHAQRAAQGDVLANARRRPRHGPHRRHVPAIRPGADRQRVPEDATTVQRAGASGRHVQRAQHRLARLRAVQPGDAREVRHHLQGREQLRVRGRRRQNARDATRIRSETTTVRGHPMARRYRASPKKAQKAGPAADRRVSSPETVVMVVNC